ncbi:MAG: nucleotidyltransferase [Flavobacteriales bacterium]|nr:MAG: nucleotidyltransferase [Flavobacteriales bacterium]
MKALLFAAGKGTRLKPFTNHHPKALAKVNDITLLERNIKYLQSFGVQDFVINIHHFGEQIVEFLHQNKNFGAHIDISDESEMLLETGGGLLFARKFLENEKDFLIMNADILTDLDLKPFIHHHQNHDNLVTLAVSKRDSSRQLLFDNKNLLKGWKNMKTGEEKLAVSKDKLKELAFSGIHCVSSKIFDKISRTGKFSIIDEYLDFMHHEKLYGYEHNALLLDVGKPESLTKAENIFK